MSSQKSIIAQCTAFLAKNANGTWYETYRLKDPESNKLLHDISRETVIVRVEKEQKRAFYWLSNASDACVFNRFVGLVLKGEAHEIITSPRCRFFYDIDLELDEIQKHEIADYYGHAIDDINEIQVMESIGTKLAHVFKEATLISLEENGVDSNDLNGFDWMFTMRNRKVSNDGFKISIHLITNIFISLNACAAIATHVKSEIISNNVEVLGIHEDLVNIIIDSIDTTQYRLRGSLGLPFGTKTCENEKHTSWIYRNYDIPNQHYLITIEDQFAMKNIDLSGYNIVDKESFTKEANPEFVKEALLHVNNIKDYNSRVWDINSSQLKHSVMYVKRYAPSMCSICERVHDNDNTLFLIFNSDQGIASWKCARRPDMKPIVFFQKEDTEESSNDLDVFASRHRKRVSIKTTEKPSKSINLETPKPKEDPEIEAFANRHTSRVHKEGPQVEDPFDKTPYKKKRHRKFAPSNAVAKLQPDEGIDWVITPKEEYSSDEAIDIPKKKDSIQPESASSKPRISYNSAKKENVSLVEEGEYPDSD